jgi:hypothetical protein
MDHMCKVKVRGETVPVINKLPRHEDVLGSGGMITLRPLYPLYPLDRRLGGPQNRFGLGGAEKNSHPARSLHKELKYQHFK